MSDPANPFASAPPPGAKDGLKKVGEAADAVLGQAKVLGSIKNPNAKAELKQVGAPADAALARAKVMGAVEGGNQNLKHVDAPPTDLSEAAKEAYLAEKAGN